MAVEDKEHLSLKVMRLSQPTWEVNHWPLTTAVDCPFGNLEVNAEHLPKTQIGECLADSHTLLLPVTQGRIFCGENFSAYINLANVSSIQLLDVGVLIEMVVGGERVVLFDTGQEQKSLDIDPDAVFDCNITFRVTNAISHVLVCSISYNTSLSLERLFFRKSFKFAAQNPINILYKVHNFQDKSLVQCDIESQSRDPLCLNEVSLMPVDGLSASNLDYDDSFSAEMVGKTFLKYKDVKSVVFAIKQEASENKQLLQGLKTMPLFGHLCVRWRSPAGGSGSITDFEIENEASEPCLIELRAKSCPAIIKVESFFEIQLEVVNRQDKACQPSLIIQREKLAAFHVEGPTRKKLHSIPPLSSTIISVNLVCLTPGFHCIEGFTVHDFQSNITGRDEPLCDVFAL